VGVHYGGFDGRYDPFDPFGDVFSESDRRGSDSGGRERLGVGMKTTVNIPYRRSAGRSARSEFPERRLFLLAKESVESSRGVIA